LIVHIQSNPPPGRSSEAPAAAQIKVLSSDPDSGALTGIVDLPAGYRTIFLLHEVKGYAHQEIAKILDCSVGNSKSQLHKARGKLREILLQDGITASELEGR
jgi:RNA polymerase sigma-70 factor (ECF subfamily)